MLPSGARCCADERTLDELEAEDRTAFRYVDNPNGSLRDIVGILSSRRIVLGMMPHPERATEALMGSSDGLVVFQSMVTAPVPARSASCGASIAPIRARGCT
jgi:phosphoribosylformylglycinamidine synthase subunit PurQ / glutaminase